MAELRKTVPLKVTLAALLKDPQVERYALELCVLMGLYPQAAARSLARLEKRGWLTCRDEMGDPSRLGRPLRKYYRLRPEKVAEARAWLATAGPLPAVMPSGLGAPVGQDPSAGPRTAPASVSRSDGPR